MLQYNCAQTTALQLTSWGTSSTMYAKKAMTTKMVYWKPMKIHSCPTSLKSLVSCIVYTTSAALVTTDAIEVICKMACQVPMSCAPAGTGRLKMYNPPKSIKEIQIMKPFWYKDMNIL